HLQGSQGGWPPAGKGGQDRRGYREGGVERADAQGCLLQSGSRDDKSDEDEPIEFGPDVGHYSEGALSKGSNPCTSLAPEEEEGMIMKVLVSDSLAEDGVKRLQSGADVDVITNLSPEELIQKIPDYDALVIRSGTKVTADVINAAKRLKVIGRAGVGIDNVDVEAATKKGIIVLNTPGGNTISAAEHTIAMMLALARNIPQANSALHQGEWNRKKYTGVEFF